jgi:hypothetical protein
MAEEARCKSGKIHEKSKLKQQVDQLIEKACGMGHYSTELKFDHNEVSCSDLEHFSEHMKIKGFKVYVRCNDELNKINIKWNDDSKNKKVDIRSLDRDTLFAML